MRNFSAVCGAAIGAAWAWCALAAAAAPAQPVQPINIDEQRRCVTIPGTVAKQNVYEQLKGAIEYALVCPGGKAYEALFICPVDPVALRDALVKIGLRPGKHAHEQDGVAVGPRGDAVKILVIAGDGAPDSAREIENYIIDTTRGGPMPPVKWVFTGSRTVKDPATGKDMLEAAVIKNLVSIHQLDPGVLIQNPTPGASEGGRYKANLKELPPEGTPVKIVIQALDLKRMHLRISGRVQGVGFREFTRTAAAALDLRGWVRNLPDGDVELLAEGDPASLAKLRERVSKGPRGARVDAVKDVVPVSAEPVGQFEVRETPPPSK